MIWSVLAIASCAVGALLLLLGAVGLLFFPDLFTRMAASSKAATLGQGLVLIGTALHFRTSSAVADAIFVIFFVFLSAPVAAHLIGRAAYRSGVELHRGTIRDDWEKERDR